MDAIRILLVHCAALFRCGELDSDLDQGVAWPHRSRHPQKSPTGVPEAGAQRTYSSRFLTGISGYDPLDFSPQSCYSEYAQLTPEWIPAHRVASIAPMRAFRTEWIRIDTGSNRAPSSHSLRKPRTSPR
jgi:hypothetical protein